MKNTSNFLAILQDFLVSSKVATNASSALTLTMHLDTTSMEKRSSRQSASWLNHTEKEISQWCLNFQIFVKLQPK